MNQYLAEQYKQLGLSEKVIAFGEKIEADLKERFEKIDAVAEFNLPYRIKYNPSSMCGGKVTYALLVGVLCRCGIWIRTPAKEGIARSVKAVDT